MKKIRYALEAVILALFFSVSKTLGVEKGAAFGGFIGRTFGPHLLASRTAIDNIRMAFPEKDEAWHKATLIGMWDNLGRVMAEYPHLKQIIFERTDVVDQHHLENIGEFEPCIVIGAHMANWELGPFYMNHRKKWPMPGIFRLPNNPHVAKMMDRFRYNDNEGLYIAKSSQGVRDMVRVLKSGQRLGNLIDQKYNGGMMTPFFGRLAPTSAAFAQLSRKFNCPILPVRIERLPESRFRIVFGEPFYSGDMTDEEVVAHSTAILEGYIRMRPEQWLWLHRRWGKPRTP